MRRRTLRALILAASVAVRHLRDDPLRAASLALRVAPGPARRPARRALAWLPERDPHRGRGGARRYGPRGVPAPAGVPGTAVPGRVLHLVTNSLPYRDAGYTVRTHAIARAQRQAGLDPQIVTRLGFPVAQGVWDGRPAQVVDGVPYHRLLPLRMPGTPEAALARNAELAARLVERLRPAVLHAATDHPNGRVALALRESFGLPVVYEVRGFLEETWLTQGPGRGRDSASYRERRALETHCMKAADLVLTLGEAMKQEIVSRGVPEERVRVVPNAVDDVFLQPLPDAGDLRTRLGIGPGEVVVGTVSTLTPHEGVGTLLRAGAELRRRGVPLRLLIVGDGPLRPALQRQAAGLGLGDAALFTGRVPYAGVRAHHAVLDVFAVPRTGARVCRLVTPLKPVEAMASGLPVAASDVTAMGELVEDQVNGRLIPPGDVQAWADALEILLYSPNRRRMMGDAARARVARDRTWAHIAGRTRDAYRGLGAV
ncbi:glycosyltransferase family 4 protein [Actinacidiphila glaucinigra]|uniref:glycosyltransferase family 4 protein n=1 Tax=Actinacidiphila glaucinigra TaxID=235986 RepID=UPI002E2F5FF7|nr:glycosyltransferase family 4 protein [Actinacidiphila glaucinigra]